MNSSTKSAIKVVLSLGFGILLIYLFYRKLTPSDIADMKEAVKTANYWWLIASVSMTLFSQTVRAMRWQALIKATGNSVNWLRAFNAISVNYLVNLGIPRAGEVARCGVLATYDGIPINKSIGTVVNERIIDLLMLLIVGVLAFFFQYPVFMDFYAKHLASTFDPIVNWLFDHPILSISVFVIVSIAGMFILRKLLRSSGKAESRVAKIIQGFKEGILSIFKLEKPFLFVAQTIVIWIFYFTMIVFAFKTIPLGVELGFGAALSLLFFGTFGFLATPGGIGAYPLIAGYLLSLYGVAVHLGTTMGWVLWIGQTILIILMGLIAFALLSREKNINPKLLSGES